MRAVILALALVFGVAVAGRSDKAAYARGMVEDLDWGIMSTISTASDHVGAPFGNPQSHAEVDGVIYFYVSDMDQSMIDIASNNQVSEMGGGRVWGRYDMDTLPPSNNKTVH
mmetsp:Transcript_26625/g.71473  ORF Transcript_26625/g.71473 Transcript_26625/m.71473 type:complete len:112 (-) Transcript_26625:601-936(-)